MFIAKYVYTYKEFFLVRWGKKQTINKHSAKREDSANDNNNKGDSERKERERERSERVERKREGKRGTVREKRGTERDKRERGTGESLVLCSGCP